MTASNYDSYLNVQSIENFLTNIKITAIANGWTSDEDSISTLGELYLHSTGVYGNQSLYYSFKIMEADDDSTKKFIVWHCNTGYLSTSDWDNQPGKFSVLPEFDYDYYSNGKYFWDPPYYHATAYKNNVLQTYWVVPTVEKQIVFANSQFIMCSQKVINSDFAGNTFVGWCTMFIGAADSVNPTTEATLNLTMSSTWSKNGFNGSIVQPFMQLPTHSQHQYYNYGYTKIPFGFNYDGVAQFNLPPLSSNLSYGYEATDPTKFMYTSAPLMSGRASETAYSVLTKRYFNGYHSGGSATKKMVKNVPNWGGSILKNTTSNTLTMVKPILWNWDASDGVSDYFYPTRASLPYYTLRMKPYHSAEDIITIGSRDFMVLPLFDINDYFGIAIEV